MLYQAINDKTGYCFGIEVKNKLVVRCAPVGFNKIGHKWKIVKEALELDNYIISKITTDSINK